MMDGRPELIAIDHDDYHARHVGHTSDGHQFFLTTPFEPEIADNKGAEYVALFLFERDGTLTDAKIDNFGPRERLDEDRFQECYQRRLRELGVITFGRIEVKPFAIERFGTTFGLVAQEPEDEEDVWVVELRPGNCMAFYEPWDSGDYDT